MKKSNWTKEELKALSKAVLNLHGYEKLKILTDKDPIIYASLNLLRKIDDELRLLNSLSECEHDWDEYEGIDRKRICLKCDEIDG